MQRAFQSVSLASLCALFAMANGSAAAEASAKESAFGIYEGYSAAIYPDQVKTSFYLPMRDGVRLAVDLYRPAAGSQPAEEDFPWFGITPWIEGRSHSPASTPPMPFRN